MTERVNPNVALLAKADSLNYATSSRNEIWETMSELRDALFSVNAALEVIGEVKGASVEHTEYQVEHDTPSFGEDTRMRSGDYDLGKSFAEERVKALKSLSPRDLHPVIVTRTVTVITTPWEQS